MTRIVEWSVGKQSKRGTARGDVDEELLVFVAREMVKRRRLKPAAVAVLHALGMSQREIARRLGIGAGTVNRHLRLVLELYGRLRDARAAENGTETDTAEKGGYASR